MCYLNYTPDTEEYCDLPYLEPRPLPRLTWAVPVDAAELGASLDTFELLLTPVQTFRLCHRFGSGPLSTMPQEILDLVTKSLYQTTRIDVLHKWSAQFACFQGRCRRSLHTSLGEDDVEELWDEIYSGQQPCCAHHQHGEDLDPDDYDLNEKLEMVREYMDEDGDTMQEMVWGAHMAASQRWLDMTCLCQDESAQSTDLKTFTTSQKTLKSHFGVEATFLHEGFSTRMVQFLPEARVTPSPGYYTSCFLLLSMSSEKKVAPRSRIQAHKNTAFLKGDVRLAFHQRIDRMNLDLNDKQTSRFARALRILDIQPAFHLTELEPSLDSSSKDGALLKISDMQLSGWSQVSSASSKKKKLRLKRYLDQKNKEVGQQQWPQFMLMAASDVVAPIDTT